MSKLRVLTLAALTLLAVAACTPPNLPPPISPSSAAAAGALPPQEEADLLEWPDDYTSESCSPAWASNAFTWDSVDASFGAEYSPEWLHNREPVPSNEALVWYVDPPATEYAGVQVRHLPGGGCQMYQMSFDDISSGGRDVIDAKAWRYQGGDQMTVYIVRNSATLRLQPPA